MTLDVLFYGLFVCHCLAASGLLLYGLNCYVMLFLHRRRSRAMLQHTRAVQQAWQSARPSYPRVTVQLPVYNEQYVIQRLVEAVVHLTYPREQLEIQILDDSTDATTAIAAALVAQYREAGVAMTLLHRQDRHGYKAGALREGLTTATGEFIAIFDADFVPQPDFLLRMLPFFADPRIGMVQARWGHINRTYSLLTLAQSVGIDGHFWVEQAARCWAGLFMNFNGSGGIWRRRAIDDAGGWQTDTLTEDLDLSYRAQLCGWRMQFVPQVVCPAEVPVQISGIKSQQHRWAKGSIQTARKLLPRVLRAPLPLATKCQAVYHLTNYLVHPLMLGMALTTPILLHTGTMYALPLSFLALIAILGGTCGPSSMYLYAQRQLYPDWHRRLGAFLVLIILGTGIALSNTRAVLEALCGVQSPFVRTPKFRIEHLSDTWRGKRYMVEVPWFGLGEMALAIYSGYGLIVAGYGGWYGILPFQLIYTLGFAAVAGLSLWEAAQRYWVLLLPRLNYVAPGSPVRPSKATLGGPHEHP